jgi:hypothetical protein
MTNANWNGNGCSLHNVPSLSNTAISIFECDELRVASRRDTVDKRHDACGVVASPQLSSASSAWRFASIRIGCSALEAE